MTPDNNVLTLPAVASSSTAAFSLDTGPVPDADGLTGHSERYADFAPSPPPSETAETPPLQSFDIADPQAAGGFLDGMRQSHPWLIDRLHHDPAAWRLFRGCADPPR